MKDAAAVGVLTRIVILGRRALLSLLVVFFLFAARQRSVGHPDTGPLHHPPRDRFSFSEPLKAATRHVSLDLNVDFDARRLHGKATLDVERFDDSSEVVLDTEELAISRVTGAGGEPLAYTLGAETLYGAPLTVSLPRGARTITVEYSTSPSASGLFWNNADQSYGRVKPYLYSLNQPSGARSWIPLQDTPTVRMTYEATIRVAPGFLPLMSAGNNPRAENAEGVYRFSMEQSVPAYLIALAAGRLAYQPFDSRTGVYSEPELLGDAAWSLQYLPRMMAAAEKLLGSHPFPRHDILLMPPTFQFGGMEHPMLNFIHPFRVITGNRAVPPEPHTLIAHELAHSWAGDATTLGSWDDVWLNEGLASYLTVRIIEEMSGTARAESLWSATRADYAAALRNAPDEAWSILHRRVPHPWYGFHRTSYSKGALFFRTLEDAAGRPLFDVFLRNYFAHFAWRWVDDRNFLHFARSTLGALVLDRAAAMEWIYLPGLPSNVPVSATAAAVQRTARLRTGSRRTYTRGDAPARVSARM